ncbi:flagellar filament capping protein FliD [Hydrogenophaga aromaticivorans]|uniref:flagellar filament capping protein FliD n=1 Tax=Hydrogenophaga aromaticivorans TaxID=2610898 RepID=UPI001B360032|nr:flagellar filament capping protein FliD [Hydrogenophaga aromaticivorans]MBQ0920979.1 flagellar filament capping protein FliD [Hydrogenophaga aromaticivorans]
MATISSPGIGSGLDVQSIVSQLVALEKAPLKQLQTQATSFQTKLSTYGTIKSQFSALGDAAAKLASPSGWSSVTATSSNSAAIGVTVAAGAPATSLTMAVQQLAKAQSTASTAVATGSGVGSGSMTIELGAWSGSSFTAGSGTPVSVTINPGEDTLAEIAAKINDADAGVSATVLKDASGERLLVRSKETGLENGFRITVADDDGNDTDASGLSRLAFAVGSANGMTQSQAGQNATATINGVSISSASNRLADTLPGMTIQLSQVTTAPVEIDVSADTEAVRANVQAFVDAYNTLNSTLSNATRYDAGTKKAGALQGDSTATGLQNALRGMMRSVTGGTPYTRLADVGIELKTGGALALDAGKFDASLSNLEGLKNLFTVDTGSATTEGFGRKIKTFAEGLIDADGLVSTKAGALQKSIDRNGQEQERVNDRAARAETRYLAQYNAMDAAVAKLSGLNAFVSQQITLWNKG